MRGRGWRRIAAWSARALRPAAASQRCYARHPPAAATAALLSFEAKLRTARSRSSWPTSAPCDRIDLPICQDRVPREFRSNLGLGKSASLVDVGPPLFRTLVVVPMVRREITSPKRPSPYHPKVCRYGLRQPFVITRWMPPRGVAGLRSRGRCSANGSGSGSGVLAQFTHELPSRCAASSGYRQQAGACPVVSDDFLSTVDGSGGQ